MANDGKVSWIAKVSNSEVLSTAMENRCIVNTIKQRKRKWLGHVLRHDVLLRDILEGRMLEKRTRRRKRIQLMSNIYKSAKKRAEDRCLWRVLEMEVNDLLYNSIPEERLINQWINHTYTQNKQQKHNYIEPHVLKKTVFWHCWLGDRKGIRSVL